MKVKFIKDYDQVNYKIPCMFIGSPSCSFKCDKEAGVNYCQNRYLDGDPAIDINNDDIIQQYLSFPITHGIVIGGLEPMDTFNDLKDFIEQFRQVSQDVIVIYTGYTEKEINEKIKEIGKYPNIIVKFGRYKYGFEPHYDPILGVMLASDNQYAKKIS